MAKDLVEFNGKKGVWRTISGRKVFIAEGESLRDAMRTSGKFREKPIRNEKSLKDEWNAKTEGKISKMNSSQLSEEIRNQLEDSGVDDYVTINGETKGYFGDRGIGKEIIVVKSTTGDNFNAKIVNVKIYEDKAKTNHEKAIINSLKKKFKDYI